MKEIDIGIETKSIETVSCFTVRELVLSSRSFFVALALRANDIQFTPTRNTERERERECAPRRLVRLCRRLIYR